jgi:hypothetical protein
MRDRFKYLSVLLLLMTQKEETLIWCPLGNKKEGRHCRLCSNERMVKIQRVEVIPRVGTPVTGTIKRRETTVRLGLRCNNDGRHMVSEMQVCPMDKMVHPVDGEEYRISEIDWMRRRIVEGEGS